MEAKPLKDRLRLEKKGNETDGSFDRTFIIGGGWNVEGSQYHFYMKQARASEYGRIGHETQGETFDFGNEGTMTGGR